MIRVLSEIKSRPWAITQEAMEIILSIAERRNLSPEAVAAELGRPLDNTYNVEIRGGVAILPVNGPLFRRASFFNRISGATDYSMLAEDFARAVEDTKVSAIVLAIDSPGGDAMGVSEFADHIFDARGSKPIIAYVDGSAASAAYWIASAADEIITSDTGLLGSIGTVMQVTDSRERDAKAGVRTHEIVSSQSPDKRVDVTTDAGRAKYQALVDSLASVFIDKVARNRGVDSETVMKEFGKGGVFVGQAAVDAGLADRVGNFEALVSELQTRAMGSARMVAAAGGAQTEVNMTEKNGAPAADTQPEKLTAASVAAKHPEVAEALRAEGQQKGAAEATTAERARIKGILASEEAVDRHQLAMHLAFESDMSVEAAVALLSKSPKDEKAKTGFAAFDKAMRAEGNPKVGADADQGDQDPAASLINTAKAMGLAK